MRRLHRITTLLCTLLLTSVTILAQTPTSERQRKATDAKPAKKDKKPLSVSELERKRYAEFLKGKHTGLIRLLPRELEYEVKADRQNSRTPAAPGSFARKSLTDLPSNIPDGGGGGVITNLEDLPSVNPKGAQPSGKLRGNGPYYSFTRLTHEYGYGSDLSLEGGFFKVGFAGADYGFIADLGDVPIETINLDTTPEARALAIYPRARQESDARLQYRQFSQGAIIGNVPVKSRVPMRLGSTYLLRAINYDQSDVLVAFRVMEIDSEGIPLILWKVLKQFSTPPLIRNN